MSATKRQAIDPQTTKTDPSIKLPPPQSIPGGPGGDEGQAFPNREEPGKPRTVRPNDPKAPVSAPDQTYGR